MNKFRKKPIVVEAVKFTRKKQQEIIDFTNGKLKDIRMPRCIDGVMTATVETLEGEYEVTENDYIIKGVQGEFYPCKPDIFHETYEEVEETKEVVEPEADILIENQVSFI